MSRKLLAAVAVLGLVMAYAAFDVFRRGRYEETCSKYEAAQLAAMKGVQILHWASTPRSGTGAIRLGNDSSKNIEAVVLIVQIMDCQGTSCVVLSESKYNWKAAIPAGQARETVLDFSVEYEKIKSSIRGRQQIDVVLGPIGLVGFEYFQEACVIARDFTFIGRALNLIGLAEAQRVTQIAP